MAIKPSHPIRSFSPTAAILAGSFVPNGTSDPVTFDELGEGVSTVTYNATTGRWLVTVNVPINAFVHVSAQATDNANQTFSLEVRAAEFSNSNKTFEIYAASSSDVSATNYAATNTVDRISWLAIVNVANVPGNGS